MKDYKKITLDKLSRQYMMFVEDRKDTINGYLTTLKHLDGIDENRLIHKKNLFSAWEELHAKGPETFALILLDLNIPPVPEELKTYRKGLIADHLNQGQTLGIWLSEHHPTVPYAYLTAYSVAFEDNADQLFQDEILKKGGMLQCNVPILEKPEIMPSEFLQKLCDIWEDWDMWLKRYE